MPFFQTQDHCSLYYATHNWGAPGPVVVFLNGTMQTTLHWHPVVAGLKDRFRVLLYDARGQGQSELGQKGLSVGTHVDDLSSLLRHFSIDRVCLLGLSHGAHVALAYAADPAVHVDGVVLCSAGAAPGYRARLIVKFWLDTLKCAGLESMLWAALPIVFGEAYLKKNETVLALIVKGLVRRNKAESLMAQLEAMDAYPALSVLAKKVNTPCLVISGSDDPLVTEEGARALSRLCGGEYKQALGAGHSVPTERPEWFNRTLLDFLHQKSY